MIKVQASGGDSAEILIHEAIGENWLGDGLTSKRFIRDLADLGDVKNIKLRINSPGGSVVDGLGIYNALKDHGARVEVVIEGLAASMASVIAMVGDNIRMAEGALMMVHSPWSFAMGNADQMRKEAEILDKFEASLIDIYSKRTGLKRDDLKAMLNAETWLDGAEAVDKGFADQADKTEADAAALLREQHSGRFSAFATKFRGNSPDITPLRIAAALKSASADATRETDVSKEAPASVQSTDIDNAAREAAARASTAALAAEADRRRKIRDSFGKFSSTHRDLMDNCLEDINCTPDQAREKLLAKVGEGITPTDVLPGRDSREGFMAGAEKALLVRMGVEKRDAANEFSGMTLTDLAARALTLAGISVKGMSRDAIARKVFATHTTSDFPTLLSNTAGKVLVGAYKNFPNTYQMWCEIGEVSDFKIHPRIQMGSFNNLATIPEGSEYKSGTVAEEYENMQAATKGRIISLTRQMLVNDDLGGFKRRAQLMGRSAARTVNTDAYTLLTSGSSNHGPTSSDTGQYFNATVVTTAGGHANLTSSGTAISTASVAVGRGAMRKQKDKGLQETLNILPSVLLCPVGKEDLAWAVLNSTTEISQSNPGKKNYAADVAKLSLATDPFLDGISATAWYLFADPNDVAPFEVAFLDGQQTPFLDEEVVFMTDALVFKVRLDYGIVQRDWRAGYKNAGA